MKSPPAPPINDAGETTEATIDWRLRQANPVRRFLNWLERLSLAVEKPIVRVVRDPQFNPLYHTGTITLFALLIILVTGIYLTMFFPFGFEDSYQAVARMEAKLVGRLMRALHRYASALAILAALLHGWRTFFMDRFRGPRWLAWVTGILMAILLWGAGLTGYWLIFDTRAQLFNQALIDLLDGTGSGVAFLNRFLLTEAAGQGWLFILGVLTVHIGLSVIVGLFFYIHIKRLRRAKVLPPRYWMAILGGLLLIGALLVPVGMLPPADFGSLPAQVPLDLFLLFYLPAALHLAPGVFWGGVILIVALLTLIPWLLLRKRLEPVQVHADRCTGCTLCAADCPYKAITMVERADGGPHKLLAVINPKMCVSCGICIGSCPPLALTLGNRPPEPLWQETVTRASQDAAHPVRVVFTCERHAAQGARALLDQPERAYFGGGKGNSHAPPRDSDDMHVEVIPLTCIGMAHPDLAGRALAAGAAEVRFIGCPPEDCANREGNLWMEHRLERKRLPKLRREVVQTSISTGWEAPNDFRRALRVLPPQSKATTYGLSLNQTNWRAMLPALVLLAVVLAATIALTGVPYRPAAGNQASIRIDLQHRSGLSVVSTLSDVITSAVPDLSKAVATRMVIEIDGQPALDKTYPLRRGDANLPVQVIEQVRLPAGDYRLRVLLFDQAGQIEPHVVLDQAVALAAGQVLPLQFKDVRLGADPAAGERLFKERLSAQTLGARSATRWSRANAWLAPHWPGSRRVRATSVPGLTAEEYLHQSIVDPTAHVVEGFSANQMPPNFGQTLKDEQISDIVAFLMTLK